MSSSRSGQWIPSPRPISLQCPRSVGVPCASRGYHASGTDSVRPSSKSTTNASSLTVTLVANAARRSVAEVLIPRPHEFALVLLNERRDPVQLCTAEPTALLEPHGLQPELGPVALPLDVHMPRFV